MWYDSVYEHEQRADSCYPIGGVGGSSLRTVTVVNPLQGSKTGRNRTGGSDPALVLEAVFFEDFSETTGWEVCPSSIGAVEHKWREGQPLEHARTLITVGSCRIRFKLFLPL